MPASWRAMYVRCVLTVKPSMSSLPVLISSTLTTASLAKDGGEVK